jgi:hypothetical protein
MVMTHNSIHQQGFLTMCPHHIGQPLKLSNFIATGLPQDAGLRLYDFALMAAQTGRKLLLFLCELSICRKIHSVTPYLKGLHPVIKGVRARRKHHQQDRSPAPKSSSL